MAGLKVVWTATATIVLHQTLTFYRIGNGSSKYSRSMYRMINDILKLVANPYMYKATTVPGIRVFHCDYCRVYYRVLEEYILVEVVFDTRQDLGKAPF